MEIETTTLEEELYISEDDEEVFHDADDDETPMEIETDSGCPETSASTEQEPERSEEEKHIMKDASLIKERLSIFTDSLTESLKSFEEGNLVQWLCNLDNVLSGANHIVDRCRLVEKLLKSQL